jgi:hypothetical protein
MAASGSRNATRMPILSQSRCGIFVEGCYFSEASRSGYQSPHDRVTRVLIGIPSED